MQRRDFNRLLALSTVALAIPGRAAAAYPDRPISIIVPFPAGGPSDTGARRIAPHLTRLLGQPVVVDNVSGAGGAIGAQKVLRSPADGYTLFYGSPNETILAPVVNPAVKYQSNEFRPIRLSVVTPLVLVGRPSLEARNVDELVELGRTRRDRPLSFGSVGVGSAQHLAGENFKASTRAQMLHVPYKGAAPVLNDLLGDQVDLAFMTLSGGTLQLIESGKLTCYGMATLAREPGATTLPTINEGRYVKDMHFQLWGGLFAPAKTPTALTERLNAALNAVHRVPELRVAIEASGAQVAPLDGLAETERFYASEIGKYRQIAHGLDLQR